MSDTIPILYDTKWTTWHTVRVSVDKEPRKYITIKVDLVAERIRELNRKLNGELYEY